MPHKKQKELRALALARSMDEPKNILIISSDGKLRDVLKFCLDGWGYAFSFMNSMDSDTTPIKKISPDAIVVDLVSADKMRLDICRVLKGDFMTASIPVIALINKRQLRTELLNLKQGIDDYLIKPPDPLDLRVRLEMAMRRYQYSFYASPLTGLPSGPNIEDALNERIRKKEPFSFIYLDIDNFKYFNDVYGYLKGDRVIMQTAYMLYAVVKKYGHSGDFMGHIGGDDFVVIAKPDRYKAICHNLILMFDRIMPFHYSEEDRLRGYVIARDRTRKVKSVPLMSISAAVVTRRDISFLKNVIEINDRVAEIKRYLKGFEGSKFMEDRRDIKSGDTPASPHMYKASGRPASSYKPLGQILLEKNLISAEKLDEALNMHWKSGILLGEILKDRGFVKEETLDGILAKVLRAYNN